MKTIELLFTGKGLIILFSYLFFLGTFIHALIINYSRKKKKIGFRTFDHYFGVLLISLVGFLPNEIVSRFGTTFANLTTLYFLIGTIIYFIYFSIRDRQTISDLPGAILMFMFASYLTSINLAMMNLSKGNFFLNCFLVLGFFFCIIINFVYWITKRME
jgi:hypothetical protein